MWVPVRMPEIPLPVWGCDFPKAGSDSLHVATAEGFFRVTLGPEPTALRLLFGSELRAVFDPAFGTRFTWGGTFYEVYGPNTGIPPYFARPNGERIGGDPQDRQLQIVDEAEEGVVALIDIGPPRGEWEVAGFSEDGDYLVVADPQGVRIFREEWDSDPDDRSE